MVLRRFLRFLSTEAPSLCRNYPASSVPRASPSPHTARPVSHELPGDRKRDHRWGFPCCVGPRCLHAVDTTPAGSIEFFARTPPSTSAFPEMSAGRLLHRTFRGLFSVHSRYGLHARQVAKCDPLHQRLQQFRCLPCCSDCYRVERFSSRVGLSPTVDQRLCTAHDISLATKTGHFNLLPTGRIFWPAEAATKAINCRRQRLCAC